MTEEEKGRVRTLVDNRILTKLKPEEVRLLVSPPDTSNWKQDASEKVLSFDELAGKTQLTHYCEKAHFQSGGRRMGNYYSFVPRTLEFSI